MAVTNDKGSIRIIIVGAGIAGLTASHYLQRLGIDHVVLEKYADVAPPTGGAISMWPHAVRILHQIGCLDALKGASLPYTRVLNCGPDGKVMQNSGLLQTVEKNHGIGTYPLERREFLQILYDNLPDKSFVVTKSPVESVKQYRDRIEVHLADGRVEVGDVALGCDGVHSLMRSIMWDHAGTASPGLITSSEKTSLTTHYKTLLVNAPPMPELGDSNLIITHSKDLAFITVSQPDATYLFAIFGGEESFTWPKRKRYTDADAEALAELVSNRPVTDEIVFAEIWKRRTRMSLLSLEEGVMKHWHQGRICLVGDAVHKVQPNLALGGNAAMEGAASIINNIHRALQKYGPKPSGTALSTAFQAYQDEQQERMRGLMNLCSMVAKVHTYATPIHRIIADWVVPLIDDNVLAKRVSLFVAGAPKMDFIPCEGFPSGLVPWEDEKVK